MTTEIGLNIANNNQDNKPVTNASHDKIHGELVDDVLKFLADNWENKIPTNLEGKTAKITKIRRDKVLDFIKAKLRSRDIPLNNRYVAFPAGELVTRSNDTEFKFRPNSVFSYLTGIGAIPIDGATLVLGFDEKGESAEHLFIHEPFAAGSLEFFTNRIHGQYWTGPRYDSKQLSMLTGLPVNDLKQSNINFIEKNHPLSITPTAVEEKNLATSDFTTTLSWVSEHSDLSASIDEMRLIKDEYEISEISKACEITAKGFENVVKHLGQAKQVERGERVVEGAFYQTAITYGNELGYGTIAAAGNNATYLHWTQNTGKVKDGDLLLLDAGVEVDSLYTADITRTLPVSGRFTKIQREIYSAVLQAQKAGFAAAKVGNKFKDVHFAAIKVISKYLDDWGLLPVSLDEAIEKKYFRRWMVHGTSHHLGLDVHDCAKARAEMYTDGDICENMVFTIEPGLYFNENDQLIPKEFRGIGVRIEDDVLIKDGQAVNLSHHIPKEPDDIEKWMSKLLQSQ